MGNLRGGEAAWTSLYENVLVQGNGTETVDLALLVMDDYNTTYPNASLSNGPGTSGRFQATATGPTPWTR